jgi:hypothetical protein
MVSPLPKRWLMTEIERLRNALAWALASGQYIERRKGGPASRRYECRVASCRARGSSPNSLRHSPKCEYWRSLLLLREERSRWDSGTFAHAVSQTQSR